VRIDFSPHSYELILKALKQYVPEKPEQSPKIEALITKITNILEKSE
jgi:hypothetical protein